MKSSLPSSQNQTIDTLSTPESEIKSIEISANSPQLKQKLIPVIEFAIATLADLIFPGLGVLFDLCLIIWHFLENESE